MKIKLLPTLEQERKLRLAHTKLQEARDAVCIASLDHHKETGNYLAHEDIRSTNPRVRIDEALAISEGVIQFSIVWMWLAAGLADARGSRVNEHKINKLHRPKVGKRDGDYFINIGNIGRVRMENFPSTISTLKKAYLLFPVEKSNSWIITLEHSDTYPAEGKRKEPAPAVRVHVRRKLSFVEKLLVMLAKRVAKRKGLSAEQSEAVHSLLTSFDKRGIT